MTSNKGSLTLVDDPFLFLDRMQDTGYWLLVAGC